MGYVMMGGGRGRFGNLIEQAMKAQRVMLTLTIN